MKIRTQEPYSLFPQICFDLLQYQVSYRIAMCVTEIMVFKSTFANETGYYVCPRCRITLEREFMPFCDRCGQRLNWKDYKKAKMIYPGKGRQ